VLTKRVLVVGTTSDYIDIISKRFPGRALFVTDPSERAKAIEQEPGAPDEVLCELDCSEIVLASLLNHLKQWHTEPSGVACFDCESLTLAAALAGQLNLSFPSQESVALCRSKIGSKKRLREAGILCPEARPVCDESEAISFMTSLGRPIVLKPMTGSGSELVFSCYNSDDCAAAIRELKGRLSNPLNSRMYADIAGLDEINPRKWFAAEEFIQGTEYSCDFTVDNFHVEIIRIARKIPASGQSLGTTLAYLLPAELPPFIHPDEFRSLLHAAARALGLTGTICMADFILFQGQTMFLEITPRPGGDCLPSLIMRSSGLDIIGANLDLAESRPIDIPPSSQWQQLVGLRLFATQSGTIRSISSQMLDSDERVIESFLKRGPGHRVILPPEDYESRLLGHVIFAPSNSDSLEHECLELISKLYVEIEPLS
jgi:biotin carboxylase